MLKTSFVVVTVLTYILLKALFTSGDSEVTGPDTKKAKTDCHHRRMISSTPNASKNI